MKPPGSETEGHLTRALASAKGDQILIDQLEQNSARQASEMAQLKRATKLFCRPGSKLFETAVFIHDLSRRAGIFCLKGNVITLRSQEPVGKVEQRAVKQDCFTMTTLDFYWSVLEAEKLLGARQANRIMELVTGEAMRLFPGSSTYTGPLLFARGPQEGQIVILSSATELAARDITREIGRRLETVKIHDDLSKMQIAFSNCDSIRAARLLDNLHKQFDPLLEEHDDLSEEEELLNLMQSEMFAREHFSRAFTRFTFLLQLKPPKRNIFYRTLPEAEAIYYTEAVDHYIRSVQDSETRKLVFPQLLNRLIQFWVQRKKMQYDANSDDVRLIFERFSLRVLQFEYFGEVPAD